MAGVSVMLAMATHRDIPPETVVSLLETQRACQERGIPFEAYFGKGSSLVHHARSKIAWYYRWRTICTHIFWVDSDIAWRAEDFLRLLAIGTVKECVTGSYPGRREGAGHFVRFLGEEAAADEHGLLPIKDTGLGFACVQRRVIEELANKAPQARFPDCNDGEPIAHIFRMGMDGEMAMGEDYAFWADVRALGYGVYVDPTIRLGHIGPKVFRGCLMDVLTNATQADQSA